MSDLTPDSQDLFPYLRNSRLWGLKGWPGGYGGWNWRASAGDKSKGGSFPRWMKVGMATHWTMAIRKVSNLKCLLIMSDVVNFIGVWPPLWRRFSILLRESLVSIVSVEGSKGQSFLYFFLNIIYIWWKCYGIALLFYLRIVKLNCDFYADIASLYTARIFLSFRCCEPR